MRSLMNNEGGFWAVAGFALRFFLFTLTPAGSEAETLKLPRFLGPVENVTAPIGREAVITCRVDDLGSYRVAWVRVDTQTILTIHTHVITRSHRVGLSYTDKIVWNLHVKNVKESDRGFYMCQINTDPMMSQLGYVQVVVPPDIMDHPTSNDMVVREGTNVTLMCAATGFPKPSILWRREDKQQISFGDHMVDAVEGSVFNLSKVNRLHMGSYLCIASNGVPPSVSKRISIIIHFPPMIWIPNQLIGAVPGEDVVLECHSEAFPKSINYWARGDNGEIIVSGDCGDKCESAIIDNAYKVTMKLTIRGVSEADYGTYVCISKNSLGETDGQIKLYRLEPSSTSMAKTTAATSSIAPEKSGHKRLNSGMKKGNSSKGSYNKEAHHSSPTNSQSFNEVVSVVGKEMEALGAAGNVPSSILITFLALTLQLLLLKE